MTFQIKRRFSCFVTIAVATFGVLATTSSAHAQSINPTLDDVFQLRVGPFFANFDTEVDIQGSPFDQEQLDDNKTTAAGFVRWRITPKFHLSLGYSQISSDDTTTLSADTPIGGINVPAGTVLSQDYETSNIPISLAYAFVKNQKTEFGVAAGVNVTTIKNRVSIGVPGAPTLTPIDQDITEPLPTIGLFWHQALSPQWILNAELGYMGLEVGGLDGNFYNSLLAIEWRPLKNVGFGASYLYNKADGTITSNGITTTFDYQYDGPFAYLMFGGGTR